MPGMRTREARSGGHRLAPGAVGIALVILQGLLTLWAAVMLWPVGAVLIAANVVAAWLLRGTAGKLCVAVASAGTMALLVVTLLLLPGATTFSVSDPADRP
jgi:hypothetical protein